MPGRRPTPSPPTPASTWPPAAPPPLALDADPLALDADPRSDSLAPETLAAGHGDRLQPQGLDGGAMAGRCHGAELPLPGTPLLCWSRPFFLRSQSQDKQQQQQQQHQGPDGGGEEGPTYDPFSSSIPRTSQPAHQANQRDGSLDETSAHGATFLLNQFVRTNHENRHQLFIGILIFIADPYVAGAEFMNGQHVDYTTNLASHSGDEGGGGKAPLMV